MSEGVAALLRSYDTTPAHHTKESSMSNHPIRFETSILFAWPDDGVEYGLQILRDGRVAKVDSHLTVLEYMTVDEAKALKASIVNAPNWNNGHDGYWGSPPNAKFHLATHNPLMN
jgi:hypothetical protein